MISLWYRLYCFRSIPLDIDQRRTSLYIPSLFPMSYGGIRPFYSSPPPQTKNKQKMCKCRNKRQKHTAKQCDNNTINEHRTHSIVITILWFTGRARRPTATRSPVILWRVVCVFSRSCRCPVAEPLEPMATRSSWRSYRNGRKTPPTMITCGPWRRTTWTFATSASPSAR